MLLKFTCKRVSDRKPSTRKKIKNCTFDGKFTAHENEVYIDVITPKNRDKEGPLVVFDNKKNPIYNSFTV